MTELPGLTESTRTAQLSPLPAGDAGIVAARPGPDLATVGYHEVEYAVAGTATSFTGATPADGRWELQPRDRAGFVTRAVLRRPPPEAFSGTLLVEWLNVSSGQDAAPDWTYLADEIVRRGHAWAGVSAQWGGVESGLASVQVDVDLPGLRERDPVRYSMLSHPGDAYCFDVYRQVARALAAEVAADRALAVGESQSAIALTSYANGVQPLDGLFDGFLIHSRGAVALPLGSPGRGTAMAETLAGAPTLLRDDLAVPVLVVQTEGDLFDRIGFLPARQPDTDRRRLWEVAGSAHADRYQIGEFEAFLSCPRPVNDGQQHLVLKSALRHLDGWARGGPAPPAAPRLEVAGHDFVRDRHGNVRRGVRTPRVDAPVQVLSGRGYPGAPPVCRLFGSTAPLPAARLRELYADAAAYLRAYAAATDAAIAAGFLLPDDRRVALDEARPDLVTAAWA